MAECAGADILKELCGHLRLDLDIFKSANCIPCRMPYITSMFMPRVNSDRPLPVPPNSKNLGFIKHIEQLINRAIPAITPHDKTLKTKLEALIKAFE